MIKFKKSPFSIRRREQKKALGRGIATPKLTGLSRARSVGGVAKAVGQQIPQAQQALQRNALQQRGSIVGGKALQPGGSARPMRSIPKTMPLNAPSSIQSGFRTAGILTPIISKGTDSSPLGNLWGNLFCTIVGGTFPSIPSHITMSCLIPLAARASTAGNMSFMFESLESTKRI